MPGHPSPCCRRIPRPGRYSRREAALHVRRAGRAPGRGGVCGARLCSAPCARRPPAEPQRSRGGGAASPVPGAGWRRARTLGPELGAPPAGTPAGPPRGEGLDAQRPAGSLIPSRPVSHMLCHLEQINLSKLMIDVLHSPARLPRKQYFSALRPHPRTPRGRPITPTPGSLTPQILWGPRLPPFSHNGRKLSCAPLIPGPA